MRELCPPNVGGHNYIINNEQRETIMGLDMYVKTTDASKVIITETGTLKPAQFTNGDGKVISLEEYNALPEEERERFYGTCFNEEEIFYWRKHHDLHGWFYMQYQKKGNEEEFNCVPLVLTNELLDELEEDLRMEKLPPTTGFFFGNNPPDAESFKQDMEFIRKARAAIAEGKVVYYYGWY